MSSCLWLLSSLLISLSYFPLEVMAGGSFKPEIIKQIDLRDRNNMTKQLAAVAEKYIHLLNQIAAGEEISIEKDITSLCTPKCKKIVNGSVWFEEIAHLVPQLKAAGEKVGSWSIEPLDTIPAVDGRTVIVHYLVPTEKAGIFNTMAILRCNEFFQITEINEIFNAYEGAK